MKNHLAIPLLVGLAMFNSCATEPKIGIVPDGVGTIVVEQTRIGTTQRFQAVWELPTGGKQINRSEYSYFDGQTTQILRPTDGRCIVWVTAPSTAGKFTFHFKARYIFDVPNADGKTYEIIEVSREVNVVTSDVKNSFWGETVEETRRSLPDLKQSAPDQPYVCLTPDPLRSDFNVATIYRYDTSGKLVQIEEQYNMPATEEYGKIFSDYVMLRNKAKTDLHYTTLSSTDRLYLGNNIIRNVDITSTDRTYQNEVVQDVINNNYKVRATMSNDKNSLIIQLWMGTISNSPAVIFSRVYLKTANT